MVYKLGHEHSEETKRKIGNALKGRIFSKETLKKQRESKLGNKNPMFSKKHTDQAKEKVRMHKLADKNPSSHCLLTIIIKNTNITKVIQAIVQGPNIPKPNPEHVIIEYIFLIVCS